ncbi:MAG: hypothetical protein ABIG87_03155 [Patescibacteria group bacterium]
MKKLSFLFGVVLSVMVFCPQAPKGEVFTKIEDNKIIVFEKTIIKTGDLPSQDFQISDKMAGELFSGQKEEYIFDQKIITEIDLFNKSFFPKPLGKIITKRVTYSEKIGWVSEILKEQPTVFSLGLIDKISIVYLGMIIFIGFLLSKVIINTDNKDRKIIALVMMMAGSVMVVTVFGLFVDIFKEIKFFSEFLLWCLVNIIALLAIYFLSKFCASFYMRWDNKRTQEKEKRENKKREADSTQKALGWLSQQHRD